MNEENGLAPRITGSFPRELEEAVAKGFSQFRKPPRTKTDVVSALDWRVVLEPVPATPEEIEQYEDAVRILRNDFYNSQPAWRLTDLAVKSRTDVSELLNEFVSMKRKTAQAFDWRNRQPDSKTRWRTGGWKHICHEVILDYWNSYRIGRTPELKGELIGGDHEVRELFHAAAQGNPEAVGMIGAHFPTYEQGMKMHFTYFGFEPPFEDVPDPASIAANLVKTIYEAPESEQAEKSRRALKLLISPSIAKGGKGGKGRPRTEVASRQHGGLPRCQRVES